MNLLCLHLREASRATVTLCEVWPPNTTIMSTFTKIFTRLFFHLIKIKVILLPPGMAFPIPHQSLLHSNLSKPPLHLHPRHPPRWLQMCIPCWACPTHSPFWVLPASWEIQRPTKVHHYLLDSLRDFLT